MLTLGRVRGVTFAQWSPSKHTRRLPSRGCRSVSDAWFPREPARRPQPHARRGSNILVFDPHFHVWNIGSDGIHDGGVLGQVEGSDKFGIDDYERHLQLDRPFRHVGGVYVEAMSVCFPGLPCEEHQANCEAEQAWACEEIKKSRIPYNFVPAAMLEDPNVGDTLERLSADPRVVGIRQIVNYAPSWPRNDAAGDLLDNPQWVSGYAQLEQHDLAFDLSINPRQALKAASLIEQHPRIVNVINHLGLPTMQDLTGRADVYWNGMEALADCSNTYMKISMLMYPTETWSTNKTVVDAVLRVISLFGEDRCMIASNFPVDLMDGQNAAAFYGTMWDITEHLGVDIQRKLFATNAWDAYKV